MMVTSQCPGDRVGCGGGAGGARGVCVCEGGGWVGEGDWNGRVVLVSELLERCARKRDVVLYSVWSRRPLQTVPCTVPCTTRACSVEVRI